MCATPPFATMIKCALSNFVHDERGIAAVPPMVGKLARQFLADRSGNFAVTFGLLFIPVLGVAGLAVDYSDISRQRWRLQETSDSAALYAVRELQKAGYAENEMEAEAINVMESNFDIDGDVTVTASLDADANRLRVNMSKDYNPALLGAVAPGPVKINVISEVAYSEEYRGAKCMMTLSETGKHDLSLNGEAKIMAKSCRVHANSNSAAAVDLNGTDNRITSDSNCFVGDVESGLSRISPPPESYCYVLPDPFEEYKTPAVGGCDHENYAVHTPKPKTLDPGVYCGGINISSGANVTFNEGLYVIKDGWFMTTGSVYLEGKGVTFYFVGDGVALNFSGGTTFNLTAMDEGDLAGFLVFFDVDADYSFASSFSGNSSTYFEGVLYFGRRNVSIDGTGDVNSGSPFSALVANEVVLNGNATINLEVDAAYADLPIPEELYEKVIEPYLVK